MRTHLAVIALLSVVCTGVQAESVNVVTRNGKTFQNCRVLQVSPDGVTFRHASGIAKVLFVDMNEAGQEKFGYDPAKTKAYEAKVKEDRQKAREAAAQAAQEKAKAMAEARLRALEAQTLLAMQQSARVQAAAAQQGMGPVWLSGGLGYGNGFGYYDGAYGYGLGYGLNGFGGYCGPDWDRPGHGDGHGHGEHLNHYGYGVRRTTSYPVGGAWTNGTAYSVRRFIHPALLPNPNANISLMGHYGALVRPNYNTNPALVNARWSVGTRPACVAPRVVRSTSFAVRR